MIDPITADQIYIAMFRWRRVELIKVIRNNKRGLSIIAASRILEQYWPSGSTGTIKGAKALFEYLNQEDFENLQAEYERLLARLEEIIIELEKMRK